MSDPKAKILSAVKSDLAEIEIELKRNLGAHLEIVNDTASHILFAGGKRLRPLLTVLCARMCGYRGDYDYTLSTVFEYLHAATLLHDDLVDGAPLRRNRPAAHAVWGNSIAVLAGDFLLARALSIGVKTGNLKIMEILAQITEEMSQGEIHQLIRKGDRDLCEVEYLEVIRRKTAVLIQGACRVGGLLARTTAAQDEALGRYGHHLGVAFQMADDLLDYTADADLLGKAVGADLKEGKMTLPLIHALQKAGPSDREGIEEMIGQSEICAEDFRSLTCILKDCGGLEYTRNQAECHVQKAKNALDIFPSSPAKATLEDIADYALSRKV